MTNLNQHYPNPFDFVPFSDKPNLFKISELEKVGEPLYEGYLEVSIKALTPVHIIGKQIPEEDEEGKIDEEGKKVAESKFYRENGKPCIPGSTIRGMLRAYIEALTNGWVSQATLCYEKYYKHDSQRNRHIGFHLFKPDPNEKEEKKITVENAITQDYKPSVMGEEKEWEMDIASYLFGYVLEPAAKKADAHAIKGRVFIEDALIDENNLSDEFQLPDINADSYFGQPRISASNWWYFKDNNNPEEPRNVKLRYKDGNFIKKADGSIKTLDVAEFVGAKIRGRKFYYHHEPAKCLAEYNARSTEYKDLLRQKIKLLNQKLNSREIDDRDYKKELDNFKRDNEEPEIYPYKAESLAPTKETRTFRVYFERLPRSMVCLLCGAICLQDSIKHKIGFGKPFGFGSVELTIDSIKSRKSKTASEKKSPTTNDAPIEYKLPVSIDKSEELGLTELINECREMENRSKDDEKVIIHHACLLSLLDVLAHSENSSKIYLYPPYNGKYFQKAVSWKWDVGDYNKSHSKLTLTEWLHDQHKKKTVSFNVYKERSIKQ